MIYLIFIIFFLCLFDMFDISRYKFLHLLFKMNRFLLLMMKKLGAQQEKKQAAFFLSQRRRLCDEIKNRPKTLLIFYSILSIFNQNRFCDTVFQSAYFSSHCITFFFLALKKEKP